MNHNVSPSKATWSKRIWHSKTPSIVSPIRGATTSRATNRAKNSNTTWHEAISVFNLAKVRRHLEEQAVLATSINEVNISSKNESIPMSLPTKAFGSSFEGSSSKIYIDRGRFFKSPKQSPRNRFLEDSHTFLKKKHFESLAEDKKKTILNDYRCENKKDFFPSLQQIVLPIQSLATSRKANMKILPRDLPFSHRRMDNNDHPQTPTITKLFGPLDLTIQEVRKLSTSKKNTSIGGVGDVSITKNINTLAIRAHTTEGKKQPIFLSTKFSSPRVISSKEELHGNNVYVQANRSAKSNAISNQTSREFLLDSEPVKLEFEANLKLKLKNIVARLRPELLEAKPQACLKQSFPCLNFIAYSVKKHESYSIISLISL